MKIVFKTLQSIDGVIQLSLDGGKNWTKHSILNIKEDGGISIPEDQDLSLIKIKSDSTTLNNLEVISSISSETAVNMSHVSDLIVDRSLKLDKKYSTENISVLDTMVVPQFILQDRTMPVYSRNILNSDASILEADDGFIDVLNLFNSIPDMYSFGYMIPETRTDNSIADALTGNFLVNIENINYEYHSYDEYLRFLNVLSDSRIIPFYNMTSIAEGETAAVQGARIEEIDYIVNAHKQDGNITLSLTPGDFYINEYGDEIRPRIVFFKKVTVQKVNTEYSAINLNGTTLDFASCKEWKELSLDNVNKFIHKYDSENNIFYTLFATTNNENIPDGLRYSMHVYLNYAGPDSNLSGIPADIWYNKDDSSNTEIYSFNFEFNDNVEDYMYYFQNDDNIWTTDDEGNSFAYALTSADKKGYKFIKDSSGNIDSVPFDFSTINEYTVAVSFIKKDGYSLYRKELTKKPQIKIEGQLPKENCIIFVNDKGEPSFITISELKTKLGIK